MVSRISAINSITGISNPRFFQPSLCNTNPKMAESIQAGLNEGQGGGGHGNAGFQGAPGHVSMGKSRIFVVSN